jgi:hypothetical protein
VTFQTALGTVTGRPEIYKPLFDLLQEGVLPLLRARTAAPFDARPSFELLQAISLMIAGGYVHPAMPGGVTEAARCAVLNLNRTIAGENGRGADIPRLAAPLIGSAIQVDLMETLLFEAFVSGQCSARELTDAVHAGLQRTGRRLQQEGKPVTDTSEINRMAADLAQRFLERRVPVLKALQAM